MDHLKQALKNKMAKVINVHIHMPGSSGGPVEGSPAEEKMETPMEEAMEKKTDLAPEVKDSQEPGVAKTTGGGMSYPGANQMSDKSPMGHPSTPNIFGSQVRDALIAQSPNHPAGGKTLDSIAKERALHAKFKK
jgi:hypothetical protein